MFPTRVPKHLLDTLADQNIGNGVIVLPQMGPPTVVPQSNPQRLLMLSGPSGTGQTTSIALTASRIIGVNNPNPGLPGPITGVVEFGNGGQYTRVEVDVPIGPFSGSFQQASSATSPEDGGVIVTVPTGVLRVYARYDNNLIQPCLMISPPQSLAQIAGVPFVGPGGPKPAVGGGIIPSEPLQTKAMAAYFSRHTSKVYRTHYLYVGDGSSGTPQTIKLFGNYFCIPPFARSLKVLRYNGSLALPPSRFPALDISLLDNSGQLLETIPIAANTAAPIIPLMGTETIVFVIGHTLPTDLVSMLAICYEIGI